MLKKINKLINKFIKNKNIKKNIRHFYLSDPTYLENVIFYYFLFNFFFIVGNYPIIFFSFNFFFLIQVYLNCTKGN